MTGRARRPCLGCGRPTIASYCGKCVGLVGSYDDGEYERNRALLLANATRCAICGKPAMPDDPLTADHIIPVEAGGTHALDNLQPAHRSCNGRKGQQRH